MMETNDIWKAIRVEAKKHVKQEPMLRGLYQDHVLEHKNLGGSIGCLLSRKLSSGKRERSILLKTFRETYKQAPELLDAAVKDMLAVCERDPACNEYSMPLIYFKGYQALQAYRVSHWLWRQDRKELSYLIQSLVSEKFAVDIHPAAKIGKGIFIDHATSIVIGETSVIEDNVSLLQEVTLGGTGKDEGDRHPKIKEGVLISAGAKILGNVTIGTGAKIGAGAVVLEDIPAHSTAVGIPAKVVGTPNTDKPALEMDQSLEHGPTG